MKFTVRRSQVVTVEADSPYEASVVAAELPESAWECEDDAGKKY